MGETIAVSAAELAELARLVGVDPATADLETIKKAADKILAEDDAKRDAQSRAQAEKVLEAEDRRLVAAAVNDGRLTAKSAQHWRDALKRDRTGNRLVLASLAPGIRPDGQLGALPDSELEAVYNRIMGPLGLAEPSKAIAASALPTPKPAGVSTPSTYLRPGPQAVAVPPEGAVVTEGRPPWEWTEEEVSNAALRNLLGGRAAGIEPPPSYSWYMPPVPGSAADLENAWRGTGYFQDGGQ